MNNTTLTYWTRLSVMVPLLGLLSAAPAFGWNDKTHMSISQAAGFACWYNSAAPDAAKLKAGDIEATNHWFNNDSNLEVTPQLVLAQVARYNLPEDKEGHLYGAIINALRDYLKKKGTGKYADFHLAFCAHYIGDLSMPLHNFPHNAFNKTHHGKNDDTVEQNVMEHIERITKEMTAIELASEDDLAREIARIANMSRQLARQLEEENRDMREEEAYSRLAHSASLLKAVLGYANNR